MTVQVSSFPPHPASVSALPGRSKQAKCYIFIHLF